MRPHLQLALDKTDLQAALMVCEETLPFIDWIEAGTPLVINAGLLSIKTIKQHFPAKPLVADIKIVDAARLMSVQTLEAGADIITVLSSAGDNTIRTCVDLAHQQGRRVLGDHICTRPAPADLRRLTELGVDFIGIHLPKDSNEGISPSQLESLLNQAQSPVVLAGGLTPERLSALAGWPIHAVVVGSAIIAHPNPAAEAERFAAILRNWH